MLRKCYKNSQSSDISAGDISTGDIYRLPIYRETIYLTRRGNRICQAERAGARAPAYTDPRPGIYTRGASWKLDYYARVCELQAEAICARDASWKS